MITFNIPDMSCGHCVKAITETIQAIDPAATLTCDTTTRQVSIESSIEVSELARALSDAGYPPAV